LPRQFRRQQRQNPRQLWPMSLAGQRRPQRHEQVFTLRAGALLQRLNQWLISRAMFGIRGQGVGEKVGTGLKDHGLAVRTQG
jgi:hypothetical protein